jgi:phytoene/squalene synthetase
MLEANMTSHHISDPALAAAITRAASKQTYYTVRFLVDRDLVDDAYRAYAYFRWVDDWLDQEQRPQTERLAFVERQRALIDGCYRGAPPADLTPEEGLLVDLIQRDTGANSGLQAYVRNMMAVMAFDADRRGRLISQRELNDYTHWLAVAVTEALHYFIGHNCGSPCDQTRYLAVTGAHVTHMLRDALEDAGAGYYNIPREVVTASGMAPWDVESRAYRDWVRERVSRARACFEVGRDYLARVENLRCRIAGYAYTRRFEVVLDCIERESYLLRAQYPERKSRRCRAEMIGSALWMALKHRQPTPVAPVLPAKKPLQKRFKDLGSLGNVSSKQRWA